MKRLLNLGCGRTTHPDWVNVDAVAAAPGVLVRDLRRGVPFPSESFDAVYLSHLLEHFARTAAPGLLAECFRVLAPGGIVRVAVPDLERIAALYLEALRRARAGEPGWDFRRDWMAMELYDQAVRTASGGEVLALCRRAEPEDRAFIIERWGEEGRELLAAAGAALGRSASVRRLLAAVAIPGRWKDAILGLLAGESYRAGAFRRSGEVHQWMYDSHSLGRLLASAGFAEARATTARESRIPDWPSYQLDAAESGAVRKPDSLYMEAAKPIRPGRGAA